MNDIKLSPPWITYVDETEMLFKNDPDVRVEYDDEKKELKLYVKGNDKAMAIEKLMPSEVEFGNIVLKTTVVPANEEYTTLDLVRMAFAGNDVLEYTKALDTVFGPMYYAVFTRDVAQFYNDEMSDINGIKSMLYADLASEVLKAEGVHFNTFSDDLEDFD